MMDLHDEIERVAYELYEKTGRIDGRDLENWVEAEKIVKGRHISKDLTTNIKRLEEKTEGLIHAAREVVKVTLQELSVLTKKVFK